jgi:hypothetical protein
VEVLSVNVDKTEEVIKRDGDLFSVTGIWKGRSINIAELKKIAWRRKI